MNNTVKPIFNIFFLNKMAVSPVNNVVNSNKQYYLSQEAENTLKKKKKTNTNAKTCREIQTLT